MQAPTCTCRPASTLLIPAMLYCTAGLYNYCKALEALETGLLGGFFYRHYCLATNVIGSEARGTMKRAVAALKAGYEVPVFPLLDTCRWAVAGLLKQGSDGQCCGKSVGNGQTSGREALGCGGKAASVQADVSSTPRGLDSGSGCAPKACAYRVPACASLPACAGLPWGLASMLRWHTTRGA